MHRCKLLTLVDCRKQVSWVDNRKIVVTGKLYYHGHPRQTVIQVVTASQIYTESRESRPASAQWRAVAPPPAEKQKSTEYGITT